MILVLIVLAIVVTVPYARETLRTPMDRLARRSADGSFVTLSRGVTHYKWLGPVRGPVAVCVHGLTTPSFVWRGLARGLAKLGYRVLIYDLYGRGYSDRPQGLQDAEFFTGQLDDLLHSQGLDEDITLIGYSMGGAIATAYCAAHPERVRQLVLIASAGVQVVRTRLIRFIVDTPALGDWLMLAMYPRRHRIGCEAERDLPSSVDGIVDLQIRELDYKGFVPAVLSSLRGILSRAQEPEHRAIHAAGVPVLAIWGERDALISLSAMGELTRWNREARQEVVAQAGHGLTYTHTDAVLEAMRDTLRDGLI